jgi:hypothetical protein
MTAASDPEVLCSRVALAGLGCQCTLNIMPHLRAFLGITGRLLGIQRSYHRDHQRTAITGEGLLHFRDK